MDLKNNRITVRELLGDPRSRAVFQRRFAPWMKHPLFNAAQSLTLAQLIELAGSHLDPKVIRETLEELRRL